MSSLGVKSPQRVSKNVVSDGELGDEEARQADQASPDDPAQPLIIFRPLRVPPRQ